MKEILSNQNLAIFAITSVIIFAFVVFNSAVSGNTRKTKKAAKYFAIWTILMIVLAAFKCYM